MMERSVELTVESERTYERSSKMVLYIGIFSIVMLFAGLSSAYVISSYSELWVRISIPVAFYYSTAIILLSSLVIHRAVAASNRGEEQLAQRLMWVTVALGLAFGITQVAGWRQLIAIGSNPVSHVDNLGGTYGEDYSIVYQGRDLVYEDGDYYYENDELREKPLTNEIAIYNNSAGAYIYLLSAVHLLHVLGGLLFFVGIWIYARVKRQGHLSNLRLRLGATYWHFVDGLWIYLLLFLLFIH